VYVRRETVEFRATLFGEDPNKPIEQKSFVSYEEAGAWLQAMIQSDVGAQGVVEIEKHTLH
jgi:hypothetical protein